MFRRCIQWARIDAGRVSCQELGSVHGTYESVPSQLEYKVTIKMGDIAKSGIVSSRIDSFPLVINLKRIRNFP